MRLHICAVGRLNGRTPEATLIDDYLTRTERTGRALSLGPVCVQEVEAKKSGMVAEAELLRRAIPDRALVVTLDERGSLLTSPEFATKIADWRDGGTQDLAFVIGGADGIDPSLRAEAHFSVSFGKMVWPHMMVRVMLAEQIYRAASILAGSPYHRV